MIYKRILVAVDGSDLSLLALKEALNLAKDQHAKLQIIHVLDNLYEGDADREQFIATRKEEGLKILNVMEKKTRRAHLEIETKLLGLDSSTSGVAEQIVEQANIWSADIVVIGTHGRHGISHIFTGSVAETIVQLASVHVLVVK